VPSGTLANQVELDAHQRLTGPVRDAEQRWLVRFSKFILIVDVYLLSIKTIVDGGSIEDADAAEEETVRRRRGGSDPPASSAPSPAPVLEDSSTVRLSTATEGAAAAKALKDLLGDHADCSPLETRVDGDSHVVRGVYEFAGEKAVIWGRDKTEERVLEMRVSMVDSVPPGRMEALSRVIGTINATVEGEFKIGEKKLGGYPRWTK